MREFVLPPTLGPLPFPADGVHLWVVPESADAPLAALSSDEQARAARFRVPGPARQFARTRGILRSLLGAYLNRDPAGLRFIPSADGKPRLTDDSSLEFNVSHTDGFAAFAFAARPVGVDVEQARPLESAEPLVRRYFTPAEQLQWDALPESLLVEAFLRGWTCKEAVLKAAGCGGRGLEGCGVDLDPRRPAATAGVVGPAAVGGPWALAWRPVGDRHAVAVAYPAR